MHKFEEPLNFNSSKEKPRIRHNIQALFFFILNQLIRLISPKIALQVLLRLDNKLYILESIFAVRYGKGVHIKHQLISYHDFFTKKISSFEKVLDVGCGPGVLSYSIACKTGANVIGIDICQASIDMAKEKFSHPNIQYCVGDVLTDIPKENFDVIIISNILEHLNERVIILKNLCSITSAKRLLIRVPLFERDWRVPLKKELGIDYRLDTTHFIEYIHELFFREMREANLSILHFESRWGEIWAEVSPDAS